MVFQLQNMTSENEKKTWRPKKIMTSERPKNYVSITKHAFRINNNRLHRNYAHGVMTNDCIRWLFDLKKYYIIELFDDDVQIMSMHWWQIGTHYIR